jgi:hypothetical protein
MGWGSGRSLEAGDVGSYCGFVVSISPLVIQGLPPPEAVISSGLQIWLCCSYHLLWTSDLALLLLSSPLDFRSGSAAPIISSGLQIWLCCSYHLLWTSDLALLLLSSPLDFRSGSAAPIFSLYVDVIYFLSSLNRERVCVKGQQALFKPMQTV